MNSLSRKKNENERLGHLGYPITFGKKFYKYSIDKAFTSKP